MVESLLVTLLRRPLQCLLPNLNVLVGISTGMWAIKLCCDEIFEVLMAC